MSDVEELINSIKECWPKFEISKENLLRPTQEIVVRFYNKFLEDYNEKAAYLTGFPVTLDFKAADCESEERLFIQLSRLLRTIDGLKFTFADIYYPTPLRTKSFFKVCTHFIAFSELIQTETEAMGNAVLKMKEDTTKLLLEQQTGIDEINEKAQLKLESSEKKSLLEQKLKSTKSSHKEMQTLKPTTEKMYLEKRSHIENLNRELQNEEYEIKRLKNIENNLIDQRITESEYQNIIQTLESLKMESKILDGEDTDIGDGLVLENKILQHAENCIRILQELDCNVEKIKKLCNEEEKLQNTLIDVENLMSAKLYPLKQQEFEIRERLTKLKEQLENLQSEYKNVNENCTYSTIQHSKEFNKLKNVIEVKYKNNCKVISDLEEDITLLEGDLDKLRKAFTSEYIRVSKAEKVGVDRFKEILVKYKEMDR